VEKSQSFFNLIVPLL